MGRRTESLAVWVLFVPVMAIVTALMLIGMHGGTALTDLVAWLVFATATGLWWRMCRPNRLS